LRGYVVAAAGVIAISQVVTGGRAATSGDVAHSYRQVNLQSDISGVAKFTDSNLVNPWGLVHSATSPWWVSDNNAGVSTVYRGSGEPFLVGSPPMPLVVSIPPAPPPVGGSAGTPTGVVFNGTGDFAVSSKGKSAPSVFIFATEDGTIAGWAPSVDFANAITAVDRSVIPTQGNGAVYKGLAIGTTDDANFLYASNFRAGSIDVFDRTFTKVTLDGNFTDSSIPTGFAPFNITNIGNKLYVTYAMQKLPDKHDDQSGPGFGFVDVYSTEGKLLKRLISHGALNSPWGLALAPDGFGQFSDDLLVGNFGDGHINAYDVKTGALEGTLSDEDGNPIFIGGLWALGFGNGANAGPKTTLFFTAGIGDETHGLFGALKVDNDT
jgi:uncharacterized protein (TIGR03118 family)